MKQYDEEFLEYFDTIDTSISPSLKAEIDGTYQAVMKAAGLSRKTTGVKKGGRTFLIAAAVVACTVITAAAYGIGTGNLFKGYFEGGDYRKAKPAVSLSESQVKEIDQAGVMLNRTATVSGTTIEARAAMGDKNCSYLLLDVTAPKGTVLNKDEYEFEDISIDFHPKDAHWDENHPSEEGGSGGWDIFTQKDANPSDNKKSFIMSISMAGIDLQNRQIQLTLKDLSVPTGKLTCAPVIKGEWKFNFKLDYDTASKNIKVNKVSHDLRGYEATIQTVNLSTLSAGVTFVNTKYRIGLDLYNPPKMIIDYKDGTQDIIINGAGTGDENSCTKVYEFNAPLDLDKVAKITIGDVEIPIA